MPIQWTKEVEKYKEELVKDLQDLVQIPSVLDEAEATSEAPLGPHIKEALDWMLEKGSGDGFTVKNVENLAGHIEAGEGEDLLGILCHVDVVPAGEGWTYPPFEGKVENNRLYARGAIDDKGPTIAAYYSLKIVKNLGIPFTKRVRMIIGTDEESNWRCVSHYFEQEEMPSIGFAPDADFPVINAEKGLMDFDLIFHSAKQSEERSSLELHSFRSGERYNMVPDFARAVLTPYRDQTYLLQEFEEYLKAADLTGEYFIESGELTIDLHGKSAHAMEPDDGKNAGLHLLSFLSNFKLDGRAKAFCEFAAANLHKDSRGNTLGIAGKDEVSGDLTMNAGKIRYSQDEAFIGLNVRYPVTYDMDNAITALASRMKEAGIEIANKKDAKPHHVDGDDPFIQTLLKVYEDQTGDKGKLLAIGGGTYARSLEKGVAFGALFPGKEDVAHQKDEYIELDDLFKATAIYAQAIYELACKK
ncbi:dipeptidase PepV [Jeotgalibacillus proteolyticus]|uniref:Dipeptidase PepV n=1 Tax=Jeotgalibacillus proteolyticus TaxID=2082395 RepID=A0A2S5GFL0_9BACL|nr:dipeptidase PepV [Jeotgalibacillus proteolyticus]PPA71695.1 dipeptidase PepV [Jeotgalibacillus proteolyticus]